MNGDDKRFLEERLTRLEVLFEEKWTQHDQRSKELKDILLTKLNSLNDSVITLTIKLAELPCAVNEIKFKAIKGQIAWLWGLCIVILGGIISTCWWIVKK